MLTDRVTVELMFNFVVVFLLNHFSIDAHPYLKAIKIA